MAEDLFQELKGKYVSVLNVINREDLRVEKMHVENNKLFIRAVAPSEEAKNHFWEAVKKVNPNFSEDLTAQISVVAPRPQEKREERAEVKPASASGAQPSQSAIETYTVVKGDTLSAIAKKFYGNANEYMRIFEANKDQLNDPDKIQIGQVLKIPPKKEPA